MADYQPGACNIGAAERRKRYRTGVASFAAAALLVVAVLLVDAPAFWLLATVLPLFGGFLGVMQARAGFCVGFAMAGVYDVSDAGGRRRVAPESGQRADRKRAIVLPLQALAAATACALGVYAVGAVAL
ncbi:hypothetical protein [Halobacterium yunchengense]|uniref:hypothetical protein n=1 Tax=Halobacterium yunchengense TaxID=3108497 RepID=UPI00300BBCD7